MTFKPYPEYKDSGVPWLGKVPKEWKVKRLSSVFFERKEKVSDNDYPPLSVTKNGIFPQLENAAKSQDGDNRKKVIKGDFVINSRSDRKGSSGLSQLTGSVSLINTVLTPFGIEENYCHKLLKSHYFKEEFYRVGKGIVADLWSTKYSEMGTIIIPLPPLLEQTQIARFLDWKTSQIAKFIKAKKKMIECLKEQKQVIINDAVTGKIDVTTGKPYPRYKESGIEWLGQVPEGWVVRYFFQSFREKCIKNKDSVESNRLSLSYGEIIRKSIDATEGLLPLSYETYQIVKYGDIILRLTDLQNDHKSLRVGFVKEKGIITSAYLCLVTVQDIIPEFASCVLKFYDFIKIFYGIGGGVRQSIGFKELKRLLIIIPTKKQQKEILLWIEKKAILLNKSISRIEREISLIQEYRDRLIADVVTGKVDVRDIKAPEFEEVIEEPVEEDEAEESEVDITKELNEQ